MLNRIRNSVKNEDRKSLLSNFFSLSVLQVVTYIIPLITLPYLVGVLGKDIFGLVAFAQVFMVFFATLVDYGFNLSATREISINRDDSARITEIYSSVMITKSILLFASLLILILLITVFDKFHTEWQLYLLSFLFVIGNALFPTWYFQGIEKMKYITIVNVLSRVIFTILIFVFVNNPDDYLYVPIFNGLGAIFGGLISLYVIFYKFGQSIVFPGYKTMRLSFIDGFPFFLSRIASVGFSNTNTFIVGIILAPQFVTYYYLADKIISVTLSFVNPVVQTIYPYLSKSFNLSFLTKLLNFLLVLSLIIISVIFFAKEYISIILLNEVNIFFIDTILILLPLISISIMYVMMGAPLLLARGYKKEFNKSMVYGFSLHLIILFSLYIYHYAFEVINEEILYLFAGSLVFSKVMILLIRLYYVCKYKTYSR